MSDFICRDSIIHKNDLLKYLLIRWHSHKLVWMKYNANEPILLA